jgi:magnesium chelatase family protein
VPGERLLKEEGGECSSTIRERVAEARTIQQQRFGGAYNINAQMGPVELKKFCKIGIKEQKLLSNVINKLGLSARGYTRILKVARTIADLDSAEHILLTHLSEAVQYRG